MSNKGSSSEGDNKSSPLAYLLIFTVVAVLIAAVAGFDFRKLVPDIAAALPASLPFGGNDSKVDTGGSGRCATIAVLEGYKLPAQTGKTGREKAVDSTGTADDGEQLAFKHLAKASQAHRDYYITMRWNYAAWDWDGGSHVIDEKQMNWMKATPRLIVVTNKTNNRKIVAAALESGPAPWTGVDTSLNNTPKQGWKNPQTGSTPSYTGRVSGFPPPALEALGAEQGTYTGKGDVLEYAWAANQNVTPGPCT